MGADAATARNACVVGVFDSPRAAEQSMRALDIAGLTGETHVSIVRREIDPDDQIAAQLSLGDDSVRNAAIGGTLGGLTGAAGAATLISVTGMGLILMTGPLVALTGAIVGAFLGAMKGWGVHDSNIAAYEELVREGKVLVVVAGEPLELQQAERLLRGSEATAVHLHAKNSADAVEIDDRPRQ